MRGLALLLLSTIFLGCSSRSSPPSPASASIDADQIRAPDSFDLDRIDLVRPYWLSDGELRTDEPALAIGADLSFRVERRSEGFLHFTAAPFTALLAQPEEPGISCLCHPEFGFGLALYDQWREHQGWILFAANHNAIVVMRRDGSVVAGRRCQRIAEHGRGIRNPIEPTAEVAALFAPYGLGPAAAER